MRVFLMANSITAIVILSAALAPASAQDVRFSEAEGAAMYACLDQVRSASEAGDMNADERDCLNVIADPCLAEPEGQTTLGMTSCNYAEADFWDDILNQRWFALQQTLDPGLFETLREAQRAWITLRDKDCQVRYDFWEGGSIRNPVMALCMRDKTADRAIELGLLLRWMDM